MVLAVACPSARATALNSVPVSGVETAVSCISARLCVLAGAENGRAVLVKVQDGTPVRYYGVATTFVAYGVSCPGASGCLAVERPSGLGPFGLSTSGVSTKLTIISSLGAPVRTVGLTTPAGVTLARISCTTLNDCELAGESVFSKPEELAFGTWNGHRVRLRYMRAPGDVNLQPGDISCSGLSCMLVGSVTKGGRSDGFVVTIHNGSPISEHLVPGDKLFGVSCTSTAFCYASGARDDSQGVVVPLRNGIAGTPTEFAGPLSGIAWGVKRVRPWDPSLWPTPGPLL
jgi:hypothetical protein